MDLEIMLCSIISPSLNPILSIQLARRSEANKRIKSSSNDTKNTEEPGSPWRPARPRSWLSIRRDSCLSVPIILSPPSSFTPSPSLISVPRPAMLVAIVTVELWPAFATMSASFWCNFAFRTLCWILRKVSILLNISEISTEVVPTSTGRPAWTIFSISSMTALYFSRLVLYTRSFMSIRAIGRLVGITTTSSL